MTKNLTIIAIIATFTCQLFAQKKEEKEAILKMAGTFKVGFNYIETFAPDSNYRYYKKYKENALEMVIVTEDTENKVSLTHFLVINDSFIIKHWRQDWIYENTQFLTYKGNNIWEKYTLDKKDVKGTWTQKVFQIDESPRYEAYGKFEKQNNEYVWTGTCLSPLPRRELLKRNDYNILKRRSRIVIGKENWYLEQDNEKLKNDTLLCQEKGMETFTKHIFDTKFVLNYWNENAKAWKLITEEWNILIEKNKAIKLEGSLITSSYQAGIGRFVRDIVKKELNETEIREAIKEYILKNCTFSTNYMTVK